MANKKEAALVTKRLRLLPFAELLDRILPEGFLIPFQRTDVEELAV
jgi:hypothetical protein